jgi:N utilization substance protein B
LIQGTLAQLGEIDRHISDQLENWDFNRLARVDCAILRMSVYCLLFQKDIPVSVTIDEAIHIAKEYGSDDSYKFINGVLDAIAKKTAPYPAHE